MAVNPTTYVRTLLVLVDCSRARYRLLLCTPAGDEKQWRFTHTLMLLDSRARSQHRAWAVMSAYDGIRDALAAAARASL